MAGLTSVFPFNFTLAQITFRFNDSILHVSWKLFVLKVFNMITNLSSCSNYSWDKCMLYVPSCQKVTTDASFFYQPPQQDCTLPRLSYTFKALRYSLAYPNIIALNAIHWCSQLEFPANTEQAIKTPSFYTYSPVLQSRWHVLVLYREVTEEQQDSGRQLGNMLLRQWVNL